MVKYVDCESWHCPYCSAKFRDVMECEDHISDNHTEQPEQEQDTYYKCEVCGQEFKEYKQAFACEEAHREGNDLKYRAYLDQLEIDKLMDAGNHPAQKKLI